jgi:hypothetical protein
MEFIKYAVHLEDNTIDYSLQDNFSKNEIRSQHGHLKGIDPAWQLHSVLLIYCLYSLSKLL